jgi:RNA polymerase sigma-70 factor (ECF subfamily)
MSKIWPIPHPDWHADPVPEPTGTEREGAHRFEAADDATLAAAISRDEALALDALISRFWVPLTTYVARIVGDMALAEDVVQRTFMGVWRDRGTWSPRSVRAFLFRSARNHALDEIRSDRARALREVGASRENRPTPRQPDDVLEESRVTDAVNDAIQSLPERRREAFTLIYLKGLSYEEVSTVMGISVKTVGHHVSAALAELRESLRHVITEGSADTSTDGTVLPLHPPRDTTSPARASHPG